MIFKNRIFSRLASVLRITFPDMTDDLPTPSPTPPEDSLFEKPASRWSRIKTRLAPQVSNLWQKVKAVKIPQGLSQGLKKDWKSSWSSQWEALRKTQWQTHFNRENLKKAIQNFDPQAATEWANRALQKQGTGFYGVLATITLSSFFLADLTALLVGEFIPEPPASRMGRFSTGSGRLKSVSDYEAIFARNLFNSAGNIPGEANSQSPTSDPGGTPVKTNLPLNLIGTLIMSNELRSIATIEDRSASMVYPVRIDDEIGEKIRILSIEPRRVIFLNKASSRREYIELPEDTGTAPRITPGRPTAAAGAGIEKVAPNQFNIARSEVDRALGDINNILTQARAVPNIENGVAAGYKLFQIVPGSIYDKLGLQNGDIISGVNGELINDPARAFELLGGIKTASHLELQVRKDGRQMTYSYDIR